MNMRPDNKSSIRAESQQLFSLAQNRSCSHNYQEVCWHNRCCTIELQKLMSVASQRSLFNVPVEILPCICIILRTAECYNCRVQRKGHHDVPDFLERLQDRSALIGTLHYMEIQGEEELGSEFCLQGSAKRLLPFRTFIWCFSAPFHNITERQQSRMGYCRQRPFWVEQPCAAGSDAKSIQHDLRQGVLSYAM
jgi:hypothetical protein